MKLPAIILMLLSAGVPLFAQEKINADEVRYGDGIFQVMGSISSSQVDYLGRTVTFDTVLWKGGRFYLAGKDSKGEPVTPVPVTRRDANIGIAALKGRSADRVPDFLYNLLFPRRGSPSEKPPEVEEGAGDFIYTEKGAKQLRLYHVGLKIEKNVIADTSVAKKDFSVSQPLSTFDPPRFKPTEAGGRYQLKLREKIVVNDSNRHLDILTKEYDGREFSINPAKIFAENLLLDVQGKGFYVNEAKGFGELPRQFCVEPTTKLSDIEAFLHSKPDVPGFRFRFHIFPLDYQGTWEGCLIVRSDTGKLVPVVAAMTHDNGDESILLWVGEPLDPSRNRHPDRMPVPRFFNRQSAPQGRTAPP